MPSRAVPEVSVPGLRSGIEWKDSPIFKGSTKYDALPDVKNIIVTGGAGFMYPSRPVLTLINLVNSPSASWLVRHLTLTYPIYNIISFDKIDYCATLNNTRVLDDQSNFTFEYGDVTDLKQVMRCMKNHNVDTVFHFAAQSHVDLSFGNSFEFTKTNVEGTHVMVETAVKLGVKRFIHISTDEVNGETPSGEDDLLENSLLAPTNPYAASKAAAEMYVNAYAKSFNLPAIIVRSNNVYGPHQYPEKIIPKFTSLLDRSLPLILHGSGTNTRRYLYAADAADAFDTILHRGTCGEIYNVGSRDEISNLNLASSLLSYFSIPENERDGWIQYVKDRPFNDKRYAVDASKLQRLGWTQKTSFEDGLKTTVEWYRRFGRSWWGNVESVLTAFPEVREGEVWGQTNPRKPPATLSLDVQQPTLFLGTLDKVSGVAKENLQAIEGAAGKRKRAYEAGGKENEAFGDVSKRVILGEELRNGDVEVAR